MQQTNSALLAGNSIGRLFALSKTRYASAAPRIPGCVSPSAA